MSALPASREAQSRSAHALPGRGGPDGIGLGPHIAHAFQGIRLGVQALAKAIQACCFARQHQPLHKLPTQPQTVGMAEHGLFGGRLGLGPAKHAQQARGTVFFADAGSQSTSSTSADRQAVMAMPSSSPLR